MANYKVEITSTAERQLKKLPVSAREKIGLLLQALAQDPLPFGVKKLSGAESTYRLRVGDYRIIYDIEKRVLRILVLKVGHRKDIYRGR